MRAVPDAKPVADSYRAHDNAEHDNAEHDNAHPNADRDIAKYKPQHQPAVEFVPIRTDQPDNDTNKHTNGNTINEQHRSDQQPDNEQHRSDRQPDNDTNKHTNGNTVNEQHRSDRQRDANAHNHGNTVEEQHRSDQ